MWCGVVWLVSDGGSPVR